jgi:hypothetical protein
MAITTAKIDNPPTLSQTIFASGIMAAFTASGTRLLQGIGVVEITSSNVTWKTINYSIIDDYTLNLNAIPTGTCLGPTGDITITINKGSPNQSSGTANGITYK